MAPLLKYALSALCVLAISPVLAAPVQVGVALERRQLAGVGAASDSILTDTDNGIGYGTEDAEDNTANNISAAKSGKTPARSVSVRQLDKISNGAGNVVSAAGAPTEGGQVASTGDAVDGDGISDAATVGAQTGATEESTLEDAGSDTP